MTLIELLAVIVILTTVVAAAIPLLSPSNDDRRLREAARTLNTYITGAQTRAIATNRPYGVGLKRLSRDTKRPEDNGVCLEVFYLEQQPPYAGFDANSRACVALHPDPGFDGYVIIRFVTRGTQVDALPSGWDADLFPGVTIPSDVGGVIRPGDVIEIGGTRYELVTTPFNSRVQNRLDASNTFFRADTGKVGSNGPVQIVARPVNNSGQQINPQFDDTGYSLGPDRGPSAAGPPPVKPPAPYWTPPSPYKILRQPTPASDEPYQLPEGTAIDLRASGVGSGEFFYNPSPSDKEQRVDNAEGIIVMFAPEGRVSRVSFQLNPGSSINPVSYDQSVVDNLYFLVGRRENSAPLVVGADPTLASTIPSVSIEEDRERLRQKLNWLVGGGRWVVIGSQTGRIATIENAFVDMAALYTKYTSSPYNLISGSEELRKEQILAAREFTREMAQVGGR